MSEPLKHPGFVDEHINCPCWSTGKFNQVPCPWHDGKDKYPLGAWAEKRAMGVKSGWIDRSGR